MTDEATMADDADALDTFMMTRHFDVMREWLFGASGELTLRAHLARWHGDLMVEFAEWLSERDSGQGDVTT